MKLFRLHALFELGQRYATAFRHAWRHRTLTDNVWRERDTLAFLPANLELVETPPHPAARSTMWAIALMLVTVLILGIFGKLDIVAVAKGRLIPSERVKIIQPALTGVVRHINVRDGQRVDIGQVLVALDTTQAAADAYKAKMSRVDAELATARANALLTAVRTGNKPVVSLVLDASEEQNREAERFAQSLYIEYVNKLTGAQSEYEKRHAELATAARVVDKLRVTLPMLQREADDYRELAKDKYVAEHDYIEKERAALERAHELEAQKSHMRELTAAAAQQSALIAQITAQFSREQLDTLDKSARQLGQYREDETKARTRERLLTLNAPVAGTVQQLAVHTLGGVVTTAQALMEIVPEDAVEVEANIENKDIGFVHPGQQAVVKIDAFPYTRYGYVVGEVISVSNDAVQDKDKRLGMSFISRIRLPSGQMQIDGKPINLTPGMTATVEIMTGRRSVIGYFLDPLRQNAHESLRER